MATFYRYLHYRNCLFGLSGSLSNWKFYLVSKAPTNEESFVYGAVIATLDTIDSGIIHVYLPL